MQRFTWRYSIVNRLVRPSRLFLESRGPRVILAPGAVQTRFAPSSLPRHRSYTASVKGEASGQSIIISSSDNKKALPSTNTLSLPKQCPGCGAAFQHEDLSAPGYLPPSALTKREVGLDKEKEGESKSFQREEIRQYESHVKQLPEELREEFTPTSTTAPTTTMKPTPPSRLVCTRCHSLLHHNSLPQNATSVAPASLKSLSILGKRRNAVVVVVADLPSFPASLPEDLPSILGTTNPVVLVLTKMDVLPTNASEQRLRRYAREVLRAREAEGRMPPVAALHLVSARKNMGIRELAKDLRRLRGPHDHVYLAGRLNVGKSELVNALLRISVGGGAHKVTASWVPGTTAGHVAVPIWRFGRTLASIRPQGSDDPTTNYRGQPNLFDTPGLMNPRVTDLLSAQDLRMLEPHKQFKPLTYKLSPGSSLLLGAMARLDHIGGEHTILVTVISGLLPHITRQDKVDALLARRAEGKSTLLKPSPQTPLPPLVPVEEFEVTGKVDRLGTMDISWPGLGWVMLTGSFSPVRLRTWAVQGYGQEAGMIRRAPLMPYEYKGRVERFTTASRKMRP
ncbi:MAG: hypothetical protein DHS80DRAFT_31776 [Piptocephalis tieghemiana]|nr:MAG: hypothetical protein DHS80DRAFT_31776 [Piptocephalis tieghemiana]